MNIKCIITDDEPIARKGLKSYIDKIDYLELSAVCEDAIQLNTILKESKIDLIFLDIEMPYLSGIDFLKNLSAPPKIIFTTAYDKYAIEGYELDVLDYLLKPIAFERFLKATNKAFDYFNVHQQAVETYFFVKADHKLEKIKFQDILFIEAMENYVAIYLQDKKVVAHATLKGIIGLLPNTYFIQTHKSYIVNIPAITSIEGNLLLISKYQVPISKYQKEEVMGKILNNRLLRK